MMDQEADRPTVANNLLKTIRLLMSFAVDREWRHDHPTVGIKMLRVRSQGFRTWTEEEITIFERVWTIGTRERLALALLLYTAQRRSDVVLMGWQHIRNGGLHVRQQKTGTELVIPIDPNLQAALDTAPRNMTFLTTEAGKPFSSAGFTNWFSNAIAVAGLPKGLAPHGLRKAACRRLAEAGCTAHQIMAISGHKTLSEIERYTKAANQRRLAHDAMQNVQRRHIADKT